MSELPTIDWRPLEPRRIQVAGGASHCLEVFTPTTPRDTQTVAQVEMWAARSDWRLATIEGVEVTAVQVEAPTTSLSSGPVLSRLVFVQFPVSLGLGLRVSGPGTLQITRAVAVEPEAAARFFLEPFEGNPRGLLGRLEPATEPGNLVVLTDTCVLLQPRHDWPLDAIAMHLATFARAVADRKAKLGSTDAQRSWSADLASALPAPETTTDPAHDSIVIRRGVLVAEARFHPDTRAPTTHVRLRFPSAIAPPFVVTAESSWVPRFLTTDVAIGDTELDRRLDVRTEVVGVVGAVLRGPVRQPLLRLRERWPEFAFNERFVEVTTRRRQSTSEVVDVLDALFELGAALFAPAPTQPYR